MFIWFFKRLSCDWRDLMVHLSFHVHCKSGPAASKITARLSRGDDPIFEREDRFKIVFFRSIQFCKGFCKHLFYAKIFRFLDRMYLCGILIQEKRAINDKNPMSNNKVMSKKFWAKVPARTIVWHLPSMFWNRQI